MNFIYSKKKYYLRIVFNYLLTHKYINKKCDITIKNKIPFPS